VGQRWSFSARMQANNVDFRQLGSDPENLLRHLATVQASAPLGPGVLSINYLRRQNWDADPSRVANFTYSQRAGSRAFVTFMLLKPLSGPTGMTAGLTLTVLFDDKHTGSSSLNGRSGATTLYSDFQRVTPADEGTGYRLAMLNGGENPRQEVTLSHNRKFGAFQADFVRVHGETSSRLGATGSIATLGDGGYFSRQLDRGFAIVQTAAIAGLPVYLENRVVTHTDRNGRALVNNLQPYLENRIRIDPLTLPMDVAVDEVELTVVPRDRGGLLVDFAMRRVRSARLVIVTTDGQPLPAWTDVAVDGAAKRFVTGMHGEVAVELPALRANRVLARMPSGDSCELLVDMPPGNAIDPVIGPLTCNRKH
jgi:outer membrane usher protein